ncbi:MAG: CARDB domain-containing protein [Solirubrobacterales bacterium]
MAGALATVCVVPSAVGGAPQRPNLDVVQAEARGPQFAFKGANAKFSFEDVTKNKGAAAARGSVTIYVLVAEFARGRRAFQVGSRNISRLDPGESDRGAKSERVDTGGLPLGAYELQICADGKHRVRESNEQNCANTGREFYVIKKDWSGSVSGVGGCCSAAKVERWNSASAHLTFGKYLGDGVFRYDFNGVMQWTVSGTSISGCTLSGSGTKAVDESNSGPGIRLAYGKAAYLGTESLNQPFFQIYWTGTGPFGPCGPHSEDGPKNRDFLQIPRRSLVFDQNRLKGSFGESGGEAVSWRWDFS